MRSSASYLSASEDMLEKKTPPKDAVANSYTKHHTNADRADQ